MFSEWSSEFPGPKKCITGIAPYIITAQSNTETHVLHENSFKEEAKYSGKL